MATALIIRRSSKLLIIAVFVASLFAGFSIQRAQASIAPTPIPIDTLCANLWTGQISFSFSGCPPGTQPIDLTTAEVEVCVSLYTGQLSAVRAGGCNTGSYPITLGGPTPTPLCASFYTGAVRYSPTGTCGSGEIATVAPAPFATDCLTDGDCSRPLPEVTDSEGDVTSYLVVNDPAGGAITDIDVFIDLSHSSLKDLDIFLESPDGTTVELFTDVGCGGTGTERESDLTVTLDDGASASITTIPCGPQMSGTFQPEGSLSDFNTESASGTWELQITDDASNDSGLVWDWTLQITTNQGTLQPVSCTDCEFLIPGTGSGGSVGVTLSQVQVNPPVGTQILDLDLTLDISHTFLGDLDIYLLSPAGTRVKVMQEDSSCGNQDDLEVIYDDEASAVLDCDNRLGFNRFLPFPGTLAAFDGENPAGTWLLVLIDDENGDKGTLDNWGLDFQLI